MGNTHFYGFTDKDALSYKINEPITFTIYPANGTEIVKRKDITFYKWEIFFDGGRYESGYMPTKNNLVPLVLTVRLDRPGFVRVIVDACDENKTPLPDIIRFDGGAGADVYNIKQSTKIPDDFDEFWDKIVEDVYNSDITAAEMTEIQGDSQQKHHITYKLKVPTPFGRPAQGILTMPKDCKPESCAAKIHFCGYGVTETPVVYEKGVINLVVNAHGIEPEASKSYYDELFREPDGELFYYAFDNLENSNPHTCYFKGMMIRNLTAARYLKTLPQWNKKDFIATGISQGALQATTVAAHDKDVTSLDISIPWLCNVAGYLDNWKAGFGRIKGWAPEYAYGLSYFDTTIQATKVTCPVKINARLGDYTCPPSGIIALYNNLNTKKELNFYQNGTHVYKSPVDIISKLNN